MTLAVKGEMIRVLGRLDMFKRGERMWAIGWCRSTTQEFPN